MMTKVNLMNWRMKNRMFCQRMPKLKQVFQIKFNIIFFVIDSTQCDQFYAEESIENFEVFYHYLGVDKSQYQDQGEKSALKQPKTKLILLENYFSLDTLFSRIPNRCWKIWTFPLNTMDTFIVEFTEFNWSYKMFLKIMRR